MVSLLYLSLCTRAGVISLLCLSLYTRASAVVSSHSSHLVQLAEECLASGGLVAPGGLVAFPGPVSSAQALSCRVAPDGLVAIPGPVSSAQALS